MDFKTVNRLLITNTLLQIENTNSSIKASCQNIKSESSEMWGRHSLLAILSKITPFLAARIGYAYLTKSFIAKEFDWQQKLRNSARISRIPHVKFYGGSINMYEWGCGPTILIVNGWGQPATQMARMIEHLICAGFRVVSFDRLSRGAKDSTDMNASAADLIEFITAVHVAAQAAGNLHAIVGHSFGAAMAMAAARDWDDFASRHVLISPIDHRQWISNEFGKYKALCLGVAIRMREVVDKRYSRLVDWDQLTVPELLRANRRPTLLIRDENDPATPLQSVTGAPTSQSNIDYFLTSRLSPEQQHSDPAVIARVIGFLRTDEALATLARNERLC